MQKSAQAFRSIGEVAQMIGVATHVLRYWETQFPQLKPMKRPDGRRYYRPDDVLLIAGLCEILRDDGMTIRGARKILQRDRGSTLRERGAARLGEDYDAPAPAPLTMTTGGTDSAEARAFPAGAGRILAQLDAQEDTCDDTATDSDAPPAHALRIRHRRRAVPVMPGAVTPWLGRLVRLSSGLRGASPQHPVWQDIRAAALSLRTALAARS